MVHLNEPRARPRKPGRYVPALVVLLLLIQLIPGARAQAPVELTHTYTFGQIATFTLSADTATAARLYLRYSFAGAPTTEVIAVPAERPLTYERNLREQPLPPFATITYWWEYTDAQGRAQRTAEAVLHYEDNRFAWQTLTEPPLTLHWVAGDVAQMTAVMDIAQAALDDLEAIFPSATSDPLTIYIYPGLPDLQTALRLSGRDWIGGEAQPELGVALVAMPPTANALLEMERVVPHELAHLSLYRYTGPAGYDNLPTWLIEGIATHFERRPSVSYALALENALETGQLLPLESLCGPFPMEENAVRLAYAQSASVVSYLRRTYGWSGIRALIAAYTDGLSCEAGLRRALSLNFIALEREWRAAQAQTGEAITGPTFWILFTLALRELAPWLILLGVLILPGVLAILLRTR